MCHQNLKVSSIERWSDRLCCMGLSVASQDLPCPEDEGGWNEDVEIDVRALPG